MVSSSLPLRKTSNRLISFVLFVYYIFEGIVLCFVPESWHQKDLTGQIVLITGGGSGIGQLMALKFVRLGSSVVIWDVNREGMKQTVQMTKDQQLDSGKLHCYQVNVSDNKLVYETAQKVKQEVGIVDILINNAGIVSGKHLLDIPDEMLRLSFDVNVLSHYYTVKAFIPEMITRNRGHIVTVASVAGNLVGCSMGDYCASKFANVAFDVSLRMELAQTNLHGIRTSIVKPYFINTGMFAGVDSSLMPFLKPEYVVDKIVTGIRAETVEIIIPYYFSIIFWVVAAIPSKCLIKLADFLGSFEFMTHFEGRKVLTKIAEENNNPAVNLENNKLE